MELKRHYFRNINLKFLAVAFTLLLSNTLCVYQANSISDEQRSYLTCTDFKFVFARGSGAEVGSARDFQPFKAAVDEVFGDSGYTYSFYELGTTAWSGHSYPAPGIGISTWQRFTTSLGALLSGGEMHTYGDSVYSGTVEAKTYLWQLRGVCPNTKVVLAGYSQGAQVISSTLQIVDPNWVYAALTFGDPKLYLPEGKMNWLTRTTAACRNENLSDYRAYVPDCYAYEGILGGYQPYQPDGYSGKLKTYCQFHDVICSAYIDLDNIGYGHATYAEQGTYKRAIQDVYNMINPATYVRPSQDVAILFDITGSMQPLLAQFQHEAIATAQKTLAKGGRVALYTYGDLAEVNPVQLCNFDTCNADNVENYIKNLTVTGGGDLPESLLSASYTLMRELNWKIGANKSLVVLTDADYHNPDRDGITEADVVTLSKSIDPVNFYILTTPEMASSYTSLATQTNGGVYTSNLASAFGDIETEILSRDPGAIYISTDLPAPDFPTVENLTLTQTSNSSVHLSFTTTGTLNFISLNDYVAGYTEETDLDITDLDLSTPVTICASSASAAGFRGEATCATTEPTTGRGAMTTPLPKAPNTGKYK
ncbi:cutinase family protein [Candidatus Saccharibacteria bacterium]|nr:cutinase family protein [Candidatus Saccharibacteria bacterium]